MDEEKCKIRKRGTSSSSSSSMVRKYRLKRPILVGKRAGSTMPVPAWKMTGDGGGSSSAGGSPAALLQGEKQGKNCQQKKVNESARKLAATLWEMNEVLPPPPLMNKRSLETEESKRNMERSTLVKYVVERRNSRISTSQLVLPDKDLGRLESAPNASSTTFNEVIWDGVVIKRKVDVNNGSPQVGYPPGGQTTRKVDKFGVGNRLKDVSDSLTTSKQLLKVLNHIWSLETKQSSVGGISVISTLKSELQWVRVQVRKSIQEQAEIDHQFNEERRAWKMKEQDRILRTISSNAGELETERKLRKQAERLNKKLGKELRNAKKEFESEKRAREILEQVSEELAKGIGEDRTEFEQLKKESDKVREEVEKEREMLQLADVLREERVQMKLSEAKYEYEEKNAAVEKLKNELEEYLGAKKGGGDISPNDERIKELEDYLNQTLVGSYHKTEKITNLEDSGHSERRSIDLNMDNHRKSFEWGYAYAIATQNDVGKSEGTNQKHAFLERNMSDCIEWDLSNINHGFSQKKEYEEDEIKRYEMIKDLRDHIVSASSLASSQGLRVL